MNIKEDCGDPSRFLNGNFDSWVTWSRNPDVGELNRWTETSRRLVSRP